MKLYVHYCRTPFQGNRNMVQLNANVRLSGVKIVRIWLTSLSVVMDNKWTFIKQHAERNLIVETRRRFVVNLAPIEPKKD